MARWLPQVVEKSFIGQRVEDQNKPRSPIAWPQNEVSGAVPQTSMPTRELDQWRFSSARLINAISRASTSAAKSDAVQAMLGRRVENHQKQQGDQAFCVSE